MRIIYYANDACAYYVMVSKIQWKPFWLATQPDNTTQMVVDDDDGWFDIGSDHNLLFLDIVYSSGKSGGGPGEWEKKKATRQCEKNIWTWKKKGKINWVAYKEKVEGKWSCLGLICRVGRTEPRRQDIMCFEDCEMAAIAKHHFEKK